MDRIAFIGLGAMGRPMACNLHRRGFDVRGFDLNPEAGAAFARAGGRSCASLEEAARDADLVVLMVVNAAQAESALFDGGALAASAGQATVCLMATCLPPTVEALAARVAATGRQLLDAPVSGGTAGAEAGSLTIMAAGATAGFAAARPAFEAMAGRVVHVGPAPGQGALIKTINQLLCGVHLAAAAEALAFAEASGVDPAAVLEIVGGTAAASWMLRDRGPRMLQDDPTVSSAIDIFVKDLGIVLDTGRANGAALPLAALAHQLFIAISGRGMGAADDSQVIRAHRALTGRNS